MVRCCDRAELRRSCTSSRARSVPRSIALAHKGLVNSEWGVSGVHRFIAQPLPAGGGQLVIWNKGAERLYGWTAAEAIGQSALTLLDGKLNPAFGDAHAEVLARGEWTGEIAQRTKDGAEVTVDARFSLVSDNAGQPQRVLCTNTDVTEKKKIDAQYLRAQRMEMRLDWPHMNEPHTESPKDSLPSAGLCTPRPSLRSSGGPCTRRRESWRHQRLPRVQRSACR